MQKVNSTWFQARDSKLFEQAQTKQHKAQTMYNQWEKAHNHVNTSMKGLGQNITVDQYERTEEGETEGTSLSLVKIIVNILNLSLHRLRTAAINPLYSEDRQGCTKPPH